MNGVIYARYSSDNQREESIEGQIRECIEFAKRRALPLSGGILTVRSLQSKNSLHRMLKNRRYIGEYIYRDTVIPDGIPAIIPVELFERVQERNGLKRTKKRPQERAEVNYLLTTKLYCGKCGTFMVDESGTSRTGVVHNYYKCTKIKHGKTYDKKTVQKD